MNKVLLTFDGVSAREADQLIKKLHSDISSLPELKKIETFKKDDLQIQKANDDTQDFGAILGIVLGAKAIEIIAQGIANWLEKRNSKTITIKSENGEVIGANLSANDVKEILEKAYKK